ncbi:MAG: hypothetical protein P0S96_03635 [Simkaniaceae bacterium]|nr:hypothetical protein [Candidatus Sacchlamyda saccharinae]
MDCRWIIMTLMPIVAFGAKKADDIFNIEDFSDQSLLHIAFDTDDFTSSESELSLLEIDEQDESLLPWEIDDLTSDEISSFVELRATDIAEEFDDVFAFDLPSPKGETEPTIEKISREKKSLFAKGRAD